MYFYYSLGGDSVGDTGVQALAKHLKHCANMKELKWACIIIAVAITVGT